MLGARRGRRSRTFVFVNAKRTKYYVDRDDPNHWTIHPEDAYVSIYSATGRLGVVRNRRSR
jgi:hypothetical protein